MKKLLCEYCRKLISGKGVKLINLAIKVSIRLFCSKKCKDLWVFNYQANRKGGVVAWVIGTYFDKFYFIKRILKVKGPNRQITYFSNDINKPKSLEIADKGVLRVSKAKT